MKDIITVRETAEYLRISQTYVRDLIRIKGLPHFRLGRRILVDKADLENWLEGQKVNG